MNEISITRPDDWHVHLRDGDSLEHTCKDMARYINRAIVMPNLTPPVTTVAQADAYRERILAAMADCPRQFEPLMVLYLTDQTTEAEIKAAAESPWVYAVKLYPAGATTNSDAGVNDLSSLYPVLEAMQEHGLPLLVHGEVTDNDIDIFDREHEFIEKHLRPMVEHFPQLKIVLEHITTAQAVDFVISAPGNVAATITVHHLMFNRNHMLVGGIRPHYYCLPILKRNIHQTALLQAATSGSPKFFVGTDSAPHTTANKENSCGCAGVYSAASAIELYAEVFEEQQALDKLEGFASHFGADFYGLERSTETINLVKKDWQMPEQLPLGKESVTPLRAGETIHWQVQEAK